jgi:hypothetical protein
MPALGRRCGVDDQIRQIQVAWTPLGIKREPLADGFAGQHRPAPALAEPPEQFVGRDIEINDPRRRCFQDRRDAGPGQGAAAGGQDFTFRLPDKLFEQFAFQAAECRFAFPGKNVGIDLPASRLDLFDEIDKGQIHLAGKRAATCFLPLHET